MMMTMIQVPWSWTWTTFRCQQSGHLAASCPSCLTSRVRTRSRLAPSLKWSDCAASGPATMTRLESAPWRYGSSPSFPWPGYGQVVWGLVKLETHSVCYAQRLKQLWRLTCLKPATVSKFSILPASPPPPNLHPPSLFVNYFTWLICCMCVGGEGGCVRACVCVCVMLASCDLNCL